MATRERDLAVFQFANPRDAFLVDDGEGLVFAFVGMQAERRALLPAIYGGLTLQNGVPIGYVQLDILGRHAELSFNQFETFRHGGAARVFARFVAVTHHVFDCDSFSIEPYQLGDGNDEGIESGAWWFYRGFGFQPRAKSARDALRRENARLARSPAHRSSKRVLRVLARSYLSTHSRPGGLRECRGSTRSLRLPIARCVNSRSTKLQIAAQPRTRQRADGFTPGRCIRRSNACSRNGPGLCSRLDEWAAGEFAIAGGSSR
jgi:hypothetical protein